MNVDSNFKRGAATAVFRRLLLPRALVVMPNTEEAQALTRNQIRTADDKEAALAIYAMGARHVLYPAS